jgi:lipopolysaccharide transport system ATP-binding protein
VAVNWEEPVMDSEPVISLQNISKSFKRYAHPADRLKELLVPGKSRAEEFWALQDISLTVAPGETLGIIGRNGSGKSTLLQIIVGTLQPTRGQVSVKGRISALLELGSGFNPEFTGRQNVFFNGRILGLSQAELEQRFDAIAAFADIGEFIDQPVKTYSSGMFIRLAFAVAVNVDPEILIVDEALAVGDVFFQAKCFRKIAALQNDGVTLLFVSHDIGSVQTLCRSAILMDHGHLVMQDKPTVVANQYYKLVRIEIEAIAPIAEAEAADVAAVAESTQPDPIAISREHRVTNGQATIQRIFVTDLADQPKTAFRVGEMLQVALEIEFHQTCYDVTAGLGLRDRYGKLLLGKHSWFDAPGPIPVVAQDETITITFTIELAVRTGEYLALLGVAAQQTSEVIYESLDIIHDAFVINVVGQEQHWGLMSLRGEIAVERRSAGGRPLGPAAPIGDARKSVALPALTYRSEAH